MAISLPAYDPHGIVLAVTGHRPEEVGDYDEPCRLTLVRFAASELRLIRPRGVITGMAQGWDQAVAQACVELGIPFWACVPFVGQESLWPRAAKQRYHELLRRAVKVRVVCDGGYEPYKMEVRNRFMIDRCDELLALYNGKPKGGTRNAVVYAGGIGKTVNNCWDRWLQFRLAA